MDAVAGIYTAESGNEIDFTGLVEDQTAVPEEPEDAPEDFDPRPLIEIRLEGILAVRGLT